MHHEDIECIRGQRDGCEVALRIVGQLAGIQRRIDRDGADVADEQGIAIRLGPDGELGANGTARTAAIIDHDPLTERFGELAADGAPDEIGAAARGNGTISRIGRLGQLSAFCAKTALAPVPIETATTPSRMQRAGPDITSSFSMTISPTRMRDTSAASQKLEPASHIDRCSCR